MSYTVCIYKRVYRCSKAYIELILGVFGHHYCYYYHRVFQNDCLIIIVFLIPLCVFRQFFNVVFGNDYRLVYCGKVLQESVRKRRNGKRSVRLDTRIREEGRNQVVSGWLASIMSKNVH